METHLTNNEGGDKPCAETHETNVRTNSQQQSAESVTSSAETSTPFTSPSASNTLANVQPGGEGAKYPWNGFGSRPHPGSATQLTGDPAPGSQPEQIERLTVVRLSSDEYCLVSGCDDHNEAPEHSSMNANGMAAYLERKYPGKVVSWVVPEIDAGQPAPTSPVPCAAEGRPESFKESIADLNAERVSEMTDAKLLECADLIERVREALEKDFQQGFINALTPDRGYDVVPGDNTLKLISDLCEQQQARIAELESSVAHLSTKHREHKDELAQMHDQRRDFESALSAERQKREATEKERDGLLRNPDISTCAKGHHFRTIASHPAKSEREWYCPNCMAAELSTLRSENAEMRKDKERLDWWEENGHSARAYENHWYISFKGFDHKSSFKFRAAIDSAKGERP